jgi:phosphoribosylformylglycinamidine synthase
MAKPRVMILRAPGTNCDGETAYAFQRAGAEPTAVHILQWIEQPTLSESFQILCFPGGFSFGDDIAAGRILASKIHTHLADAIHKFQTEDKLVLGICNGFQIMMRLGIFFDAPPDKPPATLCWNRQGRYEDRWVHLAVHRKDSPFLRGIDTMFLPIAHAEGRIVFASRQTQQELESQGQLALRYATSEGITDHDDILPFPVNPNGAEGNVAGLCDPTGRILGLMPHPERHIDPTHHPAWTRFDSLPSEGDGMAIFRNAAGYFG